MAFKAIRRDGAGEKGAAALEWRGMQGGVGRDCVQ
jgi:hypothetical protein